MKLSFSPQAALDLEEIGQHIACDNPTRALSFIDEIEDFCRLIASRPAAFKERNDIAPAIRMGVYGDYLILFRVQSKRVRIERIIHGARKLEGLIEEDGP